MNERREDLIARLQAKDIPAHVGIIMDGNGRWAQARGMARTQGHRAGVERLRSVLRLSDDLGIKALSVFAFSSENWKRPAWEINALMSLLTEFMQREIDALDREGVKITFMGDTERLPAAVRAAIAEARERTSTNKGIVFNVALNYGGRQELVRAAQLACEEVCRGEIETIDESAIERHLFTADLPPLDLLIRTSGEFRLSNFLLWQSAYAEFVFVDSHWPDFDDAAYGDAIARFQSRKRRFGGL